MTVGNVFGEILPVGREQVSLDLAHFAEILRVNKGLYRFRHAADKIILAQQLDIAAFHGGNQRPIAHFQELHQILLPKRGEEFMKIHRIER